MSCKQNCVQYMQHFIPQIPTVSDRAIKGTLKAATLIVVRNWEIGGGGGEGSQRWADGINMWPNTVLTFNHPLGVQIICLSFLWILRNVDKKMFFFSLKKIEKN